MKIIKIVAMLIAAFVAGELLTIYRARKHYTPIFEKLKHDANSLARENEVLKIREDAWMSAAYELSNGDPVDEVDLRLTERLNFSRTIRNII